MAPSFDSCSDENRGETVFAAAAMRELAGLWVKSQPVISAYISANVIDLHHAEDLVQEVAQIVAERFTTFDRSRSFVSWTLGIARNRILKYYRSRSRDRLVLSEAALRNLGDTMEHIAHEGEDRREALRNCLEGIHGRRREVLEMRYRQNASIIDISQHYGMSASAVSVMLHRVRTVLYGCVERHMARRAPHHG
jgi:RNA polymerase sigma-70 factor, ECF subfamily